MAILHHNHTNRGQIVKRAKIEASTIAARLEHAGISTEASRLAGAGYAWSNTIQGRHVNQQVMGVVDFTQPSNDKRLYLVNLNTGRLIGKFYVTHGAKSGQRYARYFSNRVNSHKSSLGVFLTGYTYMGKHGFSRKVYGLESGINSAAFQRGVVIHAAPYVSRGYIIRYHQAGYSWGCFALDPDKSKTVIHDLPKNTVLFAYASQERNDPNLRSLV